MPHLISGISMQNFKITDTFLVRIQTNFSAREKAQMLLDEELRQMELRHKKRIEEEEARLAREERYDFLPIYKYIYTGWLIKNPSPL